MLLEVTYIMLQVEFMHSITRRYTHITQPNFVLEYNLVIESPHARFEYALAGCRIQMSRGYKDAVVIIGWLTAARLCSIIVTLELPKWSGPLVLSGLL
jgi:hypothetical protein